MLLNKILHKLLEQSFSQLLVSRDMSDVKKLFCLQTTLHHIKSKKSLISKVQRSRKPKNSVQQQYSNILC